MNLRVDTHGKLPRLPRLESSYRQFKAKLVTALTWVICLFLLAGQASAAYTPVTPAALLAAVKPVTPVTTALSEPTTTTQPSTASSNDSSTSAQADPVSQKVPEIVIEIKAEEYIPPAIPVVATPAAGRFPFGQCTYYVATRREVTWIGNAGEWYRNAQASGRPVGQTPAPEAIMVTWESPLGHVAYVESVNANGSFVVSEMNNRALGGWGKADTRVISPGSVPLIGFIY